MSIRDVHARITQRTDLYRWMNYTFDEKQIFLIGTAAEKNVFFVKYRNITIPHQFTNTILKHNYTIFT